MAFAKGKHAVARCQRTGDKIPYSRLVPDQDNPGLLVDKKYVDIEHPADHPPKLAEGIALRNPSPDTDDDSASQNDNNLVTEFGWDNYFGGDT